MGETRAHPPEAGLDAAGGHGATVERELVGGLVCEGMVDADQALQRALSAEAKVSARIDDERGVAAEAISGQIGRKALAAATGVDPDAAGTADDACDGVDDDALPACVCPWGRGSPIGGDGQCLVDARRRQIGARARVARVLELSDERRVNEPIRAAGRPEGGVDGDRQSRTDGTGFARLRVEGTKLAAV